MGTTALPKIIRGITNGTAAPSKALVADASGNFNLPTGTNLKVKGNPLFDASGNFLSGISQSSGGPRRLPVVAQWVMGPGVTAGTVLMGSGMTGTLSIDNDNFVSAPAAKYEMAYASPDPIILKSSTTGAINLSTATDIVLRFYIHPGVDGSVTDWRGMRYIYLYLYDGVGGSRWYGLYIMTDISAGQVGSNFYYTPGWYEAVVNIADYGGNSALNLADVRRWSMSIGRTAIAPHAIADMTPVVTFDLLKFVTNDKARIMWRFDDGESDEYIACGYLEQLGQRGTIGVVTDEAGEGTHLNVTKLQRLQEAGHLIVNHLTDYHAEHGNTATGGTYFTDTALLLSEYQQAVNWMYANGFYKGAKIFMLPGGKWNHDWDLTVAPFTDAIWSTNTRWRQINAAVYSQANSKYIGGIGADALSAATMNAFIDSAIASKGLACFYFHSGNTAAVRAAMDYAQTKILSSEIECITPYEFIRLP